jgi:hypothetical protein
MPVVRSCPAVYPAGGTKATRIIFPFSKGEKHCSRTVFAYDVNMGADRMTAGFPSFCAKALSMAGLAVLACLSASRAEAGCGDYVHLGGRHADSADAMTSPRVDSADASGVHRRTDSAPVGERVPCSGPQCRSEHPLPGPPPAVPVESVSLKWCCAIPTDSVSLPSCDMFVRGDAPLIPVGIHSDIFRPPR